MKLNAYSIFDKAVNAYMRPFFMQTDGQALRAFSDQVMDGESPPAMHPEDYALFRIGGFDEDTGMLEPSEPKVIGRAHEMQAAKRSTK